METQLISPDYIYTIAVLFYTYTMIPEPQRILSYIIASTKINLCNLKNVFKNNY